ncbi:MAG: TRAP transporter large permease [Deltaproteobacteria bacterium]|nr:TRAP transporter large permease [Deltaproteobacteria bacterium]MBW2150335.1 TRAP transporter large permease [Deltaproteobacteria bacterium]
MLLLGIPVGYCIGTTSVIALIIKWGYPSLSFGLIAQMLVYGINNFPILAVPLFLLTGSIMNVGGVSSRIFNFAGSIVGHIRGGLAHVNVLASFIFSGMSGAAAADAAGLGQIEIKAMEDAGYDKEFSCAVTGASATIGPVVPPSVPLVLYGVLATTSVSRLFIGGIVPGTLMVVALMALCAIIAKKRNYPKGDHFSAQRLIRAFKKAFFPILTPVIIIGGIWSGVFTPTEAAGVAALYALILGFCYREFKFTELVSTFRSVSINGSAILTILACAMIYNSALTRTQVPEIITNLLFTISKDPLIILLLLNITIFIAGMFMSTAETITLFTPLFAPLLPKFGIDPIHFGIVMVLNLMIGQLTPPFGIVLYVIVRVGNIEFDKLVKACVPFYFPIFVVLLIIIFFPSLVTFLPDLVFGR